MNDTSDRGAATLGVRDTLRFNATQILPQLLRGTLTLRAGMTSLLARTLSDPQGIHLVSELRRRYERDYLWVKMAGKRSLLVLDLAGIRTVLEESPTVYGPPELKVRGISHFQPGAVTISTGDEWSRRRRVNDEVLGAGLPIHPLAAEFLREVDVAFGGLLDTRRTSASWMDLSQAFRSMTEGIVFGRDADARVAFSQLDALVRRANRVVQRPHTDGLASFQSEIRTRVGASEGGLASLVCPHLTPGDPLPVAGQVPHWLFALKGSLAVNCAYALSLIASHPDMQQMVHAELEGVDLSKPEAVDGLALLEGCLREAMRLWPTTPLIVRAAQQNTRLAGIDVMAGEQVVIHNGFNHRHPDVVPEPDRFLPERWEPGVWDYRFNALSNGPQACAGRELVLFLGKAVIGRLMQARRWTLTSPPLRPDRGIPHAFDHTAVVLTADPSRAAP